MQKESVMLSFFDFTKKLFLYAYKYTVKLMIVIGISGILIIIGMKLLKTKNNEEVSFSNL